MCEILSEIKKVNLSVYLSVCLFALVLMEFTSRNKKQKKFDDSYLGETSWMSY